MKPFFIAAFLFWSVNVFAQKDEVYLKKHTSDLNGEYLIKDDSGKVKTVNVYKNGELMLIKEIAIDGGDTIYLFSDVKPEFPGSEIELFRFLRVNIQYPSKEKDNIISGKIITTFIIEKDGSMSGIRILRSDDKRIDNEIFRVLNLMPKWTPGKQNGIPVRVRFHLPITIDWK